MSDNHEKSPLMSEAAARRVARSLGWLSLGLGLAELLAPRKVAGAAGADAPGALVRAFGAREIASGLAILMRDDPKAGLWSRVGGDLLDLATLAARRSASAGLAGVGAVLVLDVLAAAALHVSHEAERSAVARRAGSRPSPKLTASGPVAGRA